MACPVMTVFFRVIGFVVYSPLDLQQSRTNKGSASTLYGGGAIGGLVRFKNQAINKADVLVNYTTLREFNGNVYVAKKYKNITHG